MVPQHNYGPRRTDMVSSSIKWNVFSIRLKGKHMQTDKQSKTKLSTAQSSYFRRSNDTMFRQAIKSITYSATTNDPSVTIPEYEGSDFRSRTNRTQEMITRTSVHEQTALNKCSDFPRTRPPARRQRLRQTKHQPAAAGNLWFFINK
jgi:hypothetical protein